jgi:hypothetical protein
MKPPRFAFAALATAALAGACLSALAQTAPAPAARNVSEQLEADYRVIAARCGSPAFEKAFFNGSRAAVAAGLISKSRDPAEVEKTITALRRSPFVLVTATADCPAQMVLLKDLQKRRSEAMRGTTRAHKTAAS